MNGQALLTRLSLDFGAQGERRNESHAQVAHKVIYFGLVLGLRYPELAQAIVSDVKVPFDFDTELRTFVESLPSVEAAL